MSPFITVQTQSRRSLFECQTKTYMFLLQTLTQNHLTQPNTMLQNAALSVGGVANVE